MKRDATRSARLLHIFGWPILLGVLGTIGLIAALVGDGAWDALSWAGLSIPLLVMIWHIVRPAR